MSRTECTTDLSFQEEWNATNRKVRSGIDRNLRWKKAEYAASVTASGLGMLGSAASCYACLRFSPDSPLLPAGPIVLFFPALPGLVTTILSGVHASDVREKMNNYRKTAIHEISRLQPDLLTNASSKKEVILFLRASGV